MNKSNTHVYKYDLQIDSLQFLYWLTIFSFNVLLYDLLLQLPFYNIDRIKGHLVSSSLRPPSTIPAEEALKYSGWTSSKPYILIRIRTSDVKHWNQVTFRLHRSTDLRDPHNTSVTYNQSHTWIFFTTSDLVCNLNA